jgi:hypothetical protein
MEEEEGGRLNREGVTDPRPNQVKKRWPTVASEGANATSVRDFRFFFSFFFSFFSLPCPSAALGSECTKSKGRYLGEKKDALFRHL